MEYDLLFTLINDQKWKQDGFTIIKLFGELTLDAIIDKIDLKPSKKGDYTFSVKHYD